MSDQEQTPLPTLGELMREIVEHQFGEQVLGRPTPYLDAAVNLACLNLYTTWNAQHGGAWRAYCEREAAAEAAEHTAPDPERKVIYARFRDDYDNVKPANPAKFESHKGVYDPNAPLVESLEKVLQDSGTYDDPNDDFSQVRLDDQPELEDCMTPQPVELTEVQTKELKELSDAYFGDPNNFQFMVERRGHCVSITPFRKGLLQEGDGNRQYRVTASYADARKVAEEFKLNVRRNLRLQMGQLQMHLNDVEGHYWPEELPEKWTELSVIPQDKCEPRWVEYPVMFKTHIAPYARFFDGVEVLNGYDHYIEVEVRKIPNNRVDVGDERA